MGPNGHATLTRRRASCRDSDEALWSSQMSGVRWEHSGEPAALYRQNKRGHGTSTPQPKKVKGLYHAGGARADGMPIDGRENIVRLAGGPSRAVVKRDRFERCSIQSRGNPGTFDGKNGRRNRQTRRDEPTVSSLFQHPRGSEGRGVTTPHYTLIDATQSRPRETAWHRHGAREADRVPLSQPRRDAYNCEDLCGAIAWARTKAAAAKTFPFRAVSRATPAQLRSVTA